MDTSARDLGSSIMNIAVPASPEPRRRPKSRRGAKTLSIEEIYAKMTAAGIPCKIVRKKGQSPKLIRLDV